MHSRSQGVPLGSTPVVNHGVPVASGHTVTPGAPQHQHSNTLGHLIKDVIFGHEHKTHSQGVPIAPTPVHVVAAPVHHHVTPAAIVTPVRVGQPVGCFPAPVTHGHPVGVVPNTVSHGHPVGVVPGTVTHGHPVGVTPATVHTVSQGVPLSGTHHHYPHH